MSVMFFLEKVQVLTRLYRKERHYVHDI